MEGWSNKHLVFHCVFFLWVLPWRTYRQGIRRHLTKVPGRCCSSCSKKSRTVVLEVESIEPCLTVLGNQKLSIQSRLCPVTSQRNEKIQKALPQHAVLQEPFSTTYLIDVDASPKFRSYMDDKVMCMTKSRPCGFLILQPEFVIYQFIHGSMGGCEKGTRVQVVYKVKQLVVWNAHADAMQCCHC